MASRKIEDAHQILREQYLKAKEAFEKQYPHISVIITSVVRTVAEQDALYAQGRITKGNIVTYAKGGQSPHNYFPSLAIDVAFIVNGKLDWSDKYFKLFSVKMVNTSIQWGGQFKSLVDYPHYEVKGWKDIKDKKLTK